MEHGKALLIKGLLTLVALYLVLGIGYGMSFWNVLIITVVLGAISYFAGDLGVLPKNGNMMATMSDLGLTFVVVWLLGMALSSIAWESMAVAAIISALVIAGAEYFFHIYITRNGPVGHNRYSTSH
ncbi:YndM family protein [Virgibacillus xinjiangensis]|uniref:YndM family protein n=1 Tax=Virgibacillus xinjiangensis TaxID=393090 RepID=A0ABV7CR09_9BACI